MGEESVPGRPLRVLLGYRVTQMQAKECLVPSEVGRGKDRFSP